MDTLVRTLQLQLILLQEEHGELKRRFEKRQQELLEENSRLAKKKQEAEAELANCRRLLAGLTEL